MATDRVSASRAFSRFGKLEMEPPRPRITGKGYPVYHPKRAKFKLRLWTKASIPALPEKLVKGIHASADVQLTP